MIKTGDGPDGTPEEPIAGGPGNDKILTAMDTDFVYGGPGRDTIDLGDGVDGLAVGDGGRDTMLTHQAGSSLHGGAGNDILTATAPDVSLHGDGGLDELDGSKYGDGLYGDAGDDLIFAGEGDDVHVFGGAGDDTLRGGPGNDVMHGNEDSDTMSGTAGTADVIYGDEGNDQLAVDSEGGRAEGGPGNDDLLAMAPSALLLGDAGDDVLHAEEGNDGDHALVARGGEGNDVFYGGSKGDELYGGADNDWLEGKGGNDTLYGEEGDDVCAGGDGTDMCDGGPTGTDAPTPDDPDTCQADVESKHNCRDASGAWGGTADGTLTYGGITESWSSTYSMDTVVAGFTWAGDANIAWQISGTDSQGCTYDGAASVPGRAGMTWWTDGGTYDIQLYRDPGETAPVVVDCPDQEPETVDYNVMNTNAADGDNQLLPEPPVRQLTGSAKYHPMNAPRGWATWSWTVTKN